jgi:transcriptional regulator GlxA family with amidase domain
MEVLSKKKTDLLLNVQDFLTQNFAQDFTINDVSKHFGTNTLFLKRGFKTKFGITIHQYVMEKRLERAVELLETTELSIEEIAEKVGYKHVSSFSKVVKQKYGHSPSKLLMNKLSFGKKKVQTKKPLSQLEMLLDENRRLKETIENQIKIFTNYLQRQSQRVA